MQVIESTHAGSWSILPQGSGESFVVVARLEQSDADGEGIVGDAYEGVSSERSMSDFGAGMVGSMIVEALRVAISRSPYQVALVSTTLIGAHFDKGRVLKTGELHVTIDRWLTDSGVPMAKRSQEGESLVLEVSSQ